MEEGVMDQQNKIAQIRHSNFKPQTHTTHEISAATWPRIVEIAKNIPIECLLIIMMVPLFKLFIFLFSLFIHHTTGQF